MHVSRASIVALLVVAAAHAVVAQQATAVDVARLPLDLARVTMALRQSHETETKSALHIRYAVDVYGSAPRLEFFTKADNLATGPAPYGAPSHRDMLNQVTPIEYRAPIMDFSALLRWLTDKSDRK